LTTLEIVRPKAQRADKRERYYQDRVREHGRRYSEFHLPSVEVLLNLVYTYDVTASHLARRLAEHGLSLSAFNLLMILSRSADHGCPLYEIGELLLVSRANITGLMDCLERKGLVERVSDKRDRRVRVATITQKGGALLESLLPSHYSEVRLICSRLSNAEKSELRALLTKLRQSVQSRLARCGKEK
jgi:MarR family 2-MHQ and catechol resistance regulon transcriptional repressor